MNIKRTVEEISTHPMDRKEFLASAGAAALAVIGVTSVLKSLGVSGSRGSASGGYGASAYGGKKDGR